MSGAVRQLLKRKFRRSEGLAKHFEFPARSYFDGKSKQGMAPAKRGKFAARSTSTIRKARRGSSKRRYKKKLRYRAKRKVKRMAAWKVRLLRALSNSQQVTNKNTFGANVYCGANLSMVTTQWAHRSFLDLQLVVNTMVGATSQYSNSNPNTNTQKNYMWDLQRSHRWRNNNETAVRVRVFMLRPRMAVPATTSAGQSSTLSPSTTAAYATGGILQDPEQWRQGFTDSAKSAAAAQVTFQTLGLTPYQHPFFPQRYKISPLKVAVFGPHGEKMPTRSSFTLAPAGEFRYVGKFKGPSIVSFAKYGMDGKLAMNFAQTWECLPGFPIIFCMYEGVVAHSAADATKVGTSNCNIDYFQECHYRCGYTNLFTKLVNDYTASPSAIPDPQAIEIDNPAMVVS